MFICDESGLICLTQVTRHYLEQGVGGTHARRNRWRIFLGIPCDRFTDYSLVHGKRTAALRTTIEWAVRYAGHEQEKIKRVPKKARNRTSTSILIVERFHCQRSGDAT